MPDTPLSASPAPGWYAESQSSPRLRWWNGSAWTDHYRVPDTEAPAPNGEGRGGLVAAEPTSRAARRAAERETGQGAESIPPGAHSDSRADTAVTWRAVVDPSGTDPKPIRSSPSHAPSSNGDRPTVSQGDQSAASPDPFGSAQSDAPIDERATAPEAGPIPDNVVPRNARADRIPPPVVMYQPRQASGPSTGDRLPISVVPSRRNGLARASLVLTLIGVVGGALAIWWLRVEDRALAGMISALVVALLLLSTALAIGGIASAVRRSIQWATPVIALVLALAALLCAGTVAASLVIGFELPAIFSGVTDWVGRTLGP